MLAAALVGNTWGRGEGHCGWGKEEGGWPLLLALLKWCTSGAAMRHLECRCGHCGVCVIMNIHTTAYILHVVQHAVHLAPSSPVNCISTFSLACFMFGMFFSLACFSERVAFYYCYYYSAWHLTRLCSLCQHGGFQYEQTDLAYTPPTPHL